MSLDGRMLAFTIAAGIAHGARVRHRPRAAGPRRVDPLDAMRQRSRGIASSGARGSASPRLLVATQVALAFVLVLGRQRSWSAASSTLTTQDLGFERGTARRRGARFQPQPRSAATRTRAGRGSHSRRTRVDRPAFGAAGFAESTPFGFGLRPWPVIVPRPDRGGRRSDADSIASATATSRRWA